MTKRRDFIKQSVLGTAGIAVGGMGFSSKSYASIIGANERINVGIIGIRNQGRVHINSFGNLKDSHNVVIKTLCDPDEELFQSRIAMVQERTGLTPATEWDLRKVLDDKDIHAISIASTNHWHALNTVWACQAGKHVFVEKPASHNVWEGRKMIEAARKYNVRVQVGLHNRSIPNVMEAMQFLHEGGIGDVYMARALVLNTRDSYGMSENSTPPPSLHYDMWLGPAAWRPYNEKRGHYNWHWYWDTGNGDTGNTGPHTLDIARWGLNKNEHPVSIYSMGGIYGFNKDQIQPEDRTPGTRVYGDVNTYGHDPTSQETPNIQTGTFMYGDGTIIELETRGRYTNQEGSDGRRVGNLFYGTDGWLEVSGSTWRAFHKRETEPFASSGENGRENRHYGNFLDAIRSGKNEDLYCDIHEGFLSSSLPLLANISYRVGRSLKFVNKNEKFANDPEADAYLKRIYRYPYIVPDQV